MVMAPPILTQGYLPKLTNVGQPRLRCRKSSVCSRWLNCEHGSSLQEGRQPLGISAISRASPELAVCSLIDPVKDFQTMPYEAEAITSRHWRFADDFFRCPHGLLN